MGSLAEQVEVAPGPANPHPGLDGLVAGYQGYAQTLPGPGVHRGLPSAVVTVVLAFDEPLDSGWLRSPGGRRTYWALASGLHTEPAQIHHQGSQVGIQLSLTARGAREVLGLPMGALAAEMVQLDDVIGSAATEMWEQLQGESSWSRRYNLLDQALLALARPPALSTSAPGSEVQWAWRRIRTSHGRLRVDELAQELGWSRRHLAARFRAEFGLSPKQVARIARFERSRAGLVAGRPLAEVAAVCGFADQAHLSREWRAMAGYPPREWQQTELPFLQDILAARAETDAHD
jgi:AraC-like DNA-binding protein